MKFALVAILLLAACQAGPVERRRSAIDGVERKQTGNLGTAQDLEHRILENIRKIAGDIHNMLLLTGKATSEIERSAEVETYVRDNSEEYMDDSDFELDEDYLEEYYADEYGDDNYDEDERSIPSRGNDQN